MSWFRVDDKWLYTPEAQAAGLQGRALWLAVGASHCAGADTDGMIDSRLLPLLAAAAGVELEPAAEALVAAGLWHDSKTVRRCSVCADTAKKHGGVKPGDFFHHSFLETNLDRAGKTDAIHRHRDLRRRNIRKDAKLKAQIRTRDKDECQYCGAATVWIEGNPDRKSKTLGEIDHVDPWGPDYDPSNLVVACKGCNSDKKDRNPLQWAEAGGRLLRRAIDGSTPPTWVDHGSITDPTRVDQDGITVLPRVTRDSGRDPGRAVVGAGSWSRKPGSGPGSGVAGA